MTRIAATLAIVLLMPMMAACSPDPAPSSSVAKCQAEMFPSFNLRDREQCIAACIKCERGVTTTCATSCSLKGAK